LLIEIYILSGITLQDVTNEFERRYQGGLYKTEKLVVSKDLLLRLRQNKFVKINSIHPK
jgi:hypothetical protein